MGTHLPGPSSLGRIDACLASEVLPHAEARTAPARRGQVLHNFLRACTHGAGDFAARRSTALTAVPREYRTACETIDFSRLPPLDPRTATAELSLAYHTRTGAVRVLTAGFAETEREAIRAMASEEEVVGTVDWAAISGSAFVALDWKTGYVEVDPAEVNAQFRTYGLMGARAYGCSSAIVGGVRILEDGRIWWDVVTMDPMDLALQEAHLLDLLSRRELALREYAHARKLPKLVEGAHCTFCPAYAFCPAKTALLRSTLRGEESAAEIARQAPRALTMETVGRLYLQVEQAEELLKRMRQRIRDWVRANGDVPLGNGYTLRKEESVSRSLRAAEAHALLTERLGENFTSGLLKMEQRITKEDFRARISERLDEVWTYLLEAGAVRPEERRTVAAAERALVDLLAIAGAVQFTPLTRVDAYRDKPQRSLPRLKRGQED